MKLRVLSDIHLEFYEYEHEFIYKFMPDCVLILAGDIGDPTSSLYKRFVTEISKFYERVIIIAGNHEYYQKYIINLLDLLRNRVIGSLSSVNVARCLLMK